MNLLIIANSDNHGRMAETIRQLGESQKDPVNGKLLVIHESSVPAKDLQQAASELAGRFKVAEILPVMVNSRLTPAVKNATLFATFLLKAYSKAAGPWTIIDDPARPKADNIISEIAAQHRGSLARMTGRGILSEGALIPVGPVTIELPAKELKVLISQAGVSWRDRGKYLFSRCGFRMIEIDDYLWDVTGLAAHAAAPAVPAPREIEPSNPPIGRTPPAKPVVAVERQPTVAAHAEQIAAAQQDEPEHKPLPLDEISGGDIPPDIAPIKDADLADLGHNELYNLLWGLTGEKPHPSIGDPRLKSRIEAIRKAGE